MIGPMADAEPQTYLALATQLAAEAVRLTRSRSGPETIARKEDHSLVTDVDHDLQALIVGRIAETHPDHAIVAEETLADTSTQAYPATARHCWVIDPLDGTRNYAMGLPCYATAIALLDRGEPIIGVVAEHNSELVFAAAKGRGTTLNGQPIRVADPAAHKDTLIGIPSSKDELTVRTLQAWVATRGFVLRNTGSTALHLSLVASGALNASFCKRCKIWDVAAGALLVTEAGGVMTDPAGRPITPFDLTKDPNTDLPTLASAPGLHERLIESIARARA